MSKFFSIGKVVYPVTAVKSVRGRSTAIQNEVVIEFLDGSEEIVGTYWVSDIDDYLNICKVFHIHPETLIVEMVHEHFRCNSNRN